jgi:flagellar hook-associated protein 2
MSSVSSISSYSTTRITGLYSGLDTDSLVENLMATQQAKLDKIYQQKTKLEWKRDAYTDINTQLKAFRTKYMSATSESNMFTSSAYKAYAVQIDENKYVDVTATSAAYTDSHEISSVQLAASAVSAGEKYRSRSAGFWGTQETNSAARVTGTKTLQDGAQSVALKDLTYEDGTQVFDFGDDNEKLTFSINGESFVFNQDETLGDVIDAVNAGETAGATMILNGDGTISINSDLVGIEATLSLKNIAGSCDLFGDEGALGIAEGDITKVSLISESMTLAEIEAATGKTFGEDTSGNVSFSINGQEFSFAKTQTLGDVISTVNADASANVTMTYDEQADQFVIRSTVLGDGSSIEILNTDGSLFFSADSPVAIEEGTSGELDAIDPQNDSIREAALKMGVDLALDSEGNFSFTVNGTDFSFDPTQTSVSAMVAKVTQDADVNLIYSSITDSFIFRSDDTGDEAVIELSNADGSNAFGADGFFGITALSAQGSDAQIVIDGETITRDSNSFEIDGMQFDLKASFDSTDPESTQEAISFSVSQDIDGVVEKVKAFIEEYNSIVEMLNEKISEKTDYDYSILTEAQRDEMDDSDLEKWDEKAKSGILRNDSNISNLLADMRADLFKKVSDTNLSASDIGLSTGAWYDKGQITLDEDTLRAALADDIEAVTKVFVGSTDSTDPDVIEQESGIITSFFKSMTDYQNAVTTGSLQNTNDAISDASDKYDELVEKMADQEDEYYLKFATMETLLSQYTAQSEWLSQQLGTL